MSDNSAAVQAAHGRHFFGDVRQVEYRALHSGPDNEGASTLNADQDAICLQLAQRPTNRQARGAKLTSQFFLRGDLEVCRPLRRLNATVYGILDLFVERLIVAHKGTKMISLCLRIIASVRPRDQDESVHMRQFLDDFPRTCELFSELS